MEDRLIELEIKVSHQEADIEKLRERVFAQDIEIDKLIQGIKLLKSKLEALAQGEGVIGAADEKPPHY